MTDWKFYGILTIFFEHQNIFFFLNHLITGVIIIKKGLLKRVPVQNSR